MRVEGKIARYLYNGVESIGVLKNGKLRAFRDVNRIEELFNAIDSKELDSNEIMLDSATLLAPIKHPAQDIICLGINFLEHAEESMRFKGEAFDGKREEAVYFSKRVNECLNPESTFYIEDKTSKLDYEVELCVIIGRDCKNVARDKAIEYVFGYCVANDISARDLQQKHKQWYIGKSLEGSFVMGPAITLKNDIDISNLYIKSFVNGELRQNSNLSKLIFNVPYVIEELSKYFIIKAGSIISMGTPSGVGMGFNPPRFLKSGDVVKCEIESLGEINTKIK